MNPEHCEYEDFGGVDGHFPLVGLVFGIWPIARHTCSMLSY